MGNLASTDITKQAIRTGGRTYRKEFPEDAAQTFVAGDVLTADAAGQCTLGAASGATLDSTGNRIIGQALEAASGTENTLIAVEVWTNDTYIDLPKYHSTAATAATARTDVDAQCNLRNDASFGWVWDYETVTNPVGHCVGIPKSYDGKPMSVGGQYNPLRCRIIGTELFDNS